MASSDNVSKRPSFAQSLKAPENNHAYLHWPRIIFFNITGGLAVTVTGLSSRGLVIINGQKNYIKQTLPGGALWGQDVIGASGAVVATCGFAAIYCTILSIIATFRLQHTETKKTVMLKEALFGFCVIAELATLIPFTYIVATKNARISSSLYPQSVVDTIVAASGQSTAYKDSIAKPTVIVGWLCWLSTCITFVLVALAARHILKYGPEDPPTLSFGHHSHQNGHSNGSAKPSMEREEKVERSV